MKNPRYWKPKHLRNAAAAVGSAMVYSAHLSVASATLPAETVVALEHATLIDGTGREPQRNMSVVITGRIITDVYVTGAKALPLGARVVNLTGQYVLPGLIDSHVHLGTQPRPPGVLDGIVRAAFMDGITTVRDMGGSALIVRPLAAASMSDTLPIPRVFYSAIFAGPGRWFEGPFGENAAGGSPMGESPLVRRVGPTTDVRAVVSAAKAAGATGIKIYNEVEPSLLRRLAAEAKRQNLRVWSHLFVDPGTPSDLLSAGVQVVSHGDQFRAELLPEALRRHGDSTTRARRAIEYAQMSPADPALTALLDRMRRAGTVLDPTLLVMLPRDLPRDTSRANMERVYGAFRFNEAMTRRAVQMGIPIIAGTDGIGGSTANLHAELQLLVDSAGLTPLQAIRAATLNGAVALGKQDSLGTVARGKIADLVVLSSDPTRSIRNTQTIAMVVKGGRTYKRTAPMKSGPFAKPPD